MTESAATDLAAQRFALLVEALSQRIQSPLDPGEGTVLLADDGGALRLAIEVAEGRGALFVIVPFLRFPEDPGRLGELALQLLQVNADREVLRDTTLAADGVRQQFCAIRELPLDMEPVPFIEAIEAIVRLAAQVAEHIEGKPQPAGGDLMAVMTQRA